MEVSEKIVKKYYLFILTYNIGSDTIYSAINKKETLNIDEDGEICSYHRMLKLY